MAKIAILYPSDPAGHAPSGIDSIIRGMLKWAPPDLEYTLLGATTDQRARPVGSEVVLCFRLPGSGTLLCLCAVVTRGQGFRVGLRFVQPTAQQRLLLSELCHS